jgi:hypothetical protein
LLRAHPAAPQLVLEHERQNEAALRATEAALEILVSAGFDPQHASEVARSTLWTGISLVMSETGYGPDLHYRLGVELCIAGVRAMAGRWTG